jgi:tetratricopeptide (TPR) repeat protein
MLAQGWKHFNAGQYHEVEPICQRALRDDPGDADAWHLLAMMHVRLARLDEAEACLRRAVEARPGFVAALCNLGIVQAMRGRSEEAIGRFRQALVLDPSLADVHNNLGCALRDLGRLDEAEASFRAALELAPEHSMAFRSLVTLLEAGRRYAELEPILRRVLRLLPRHVAARVRLGVTHRALGRPREASASFQEALLLDPANAEALSGLGSALEALGRIEESAACFRLSRRIGSEWSGGRDPGVGDPTDEDRGILRRALEPPPDDPVAWNNRGVILDMLGRSDEAMTCYERALRVAPDDGYALNNMAAILNRRGEYRRALEVFDRVLRTHPGHAEAHTNRGGILETLGDYAGALDAFERAIRAEPDYAEAISNRGLVRLKLGDFARGWPDFEWRWKRQSHAMPRHPAPLWSGEPLEGRAILLHAEQGLGDTLQFIRYAPLVRDRGGRVVVECQPPLADLLENCPGVDRVIPRGEPLPPFDVHAPLMNLPGLLGTTVETIPAPIPYLTADLELVARWREALAPIEGFRVGIVWRGNPEHVRDRHRSFPLALYEPLARIEGVRLISLQRGPGAEQLGALRGRFAVADLGEGMDPGLATMRDLPAVVANLDLVIAADTVVVHLAGAMGVRVWIALSSFSDYRWLLDREDSPWYPTARLFRQARLDDWGGVFDRMAAELAAMVAAGPRIGPGSNPPAP